MSPLLVLPLLAALAAPQGQLDPEQGPDGRSHFLGRQIAQTMHWTGAPWLLRKTREDEENGALLRRWLAVTPGQAVCDLGCGNGYHALPLAEATGSTGKVYAVDLQPQMLELLQLRAKGKGLDHVVLIEATVDDPKLPPASCDLVLLVDVYHELSHPVRVMGHVRAALKPNGRVVLVEFRAEDPAVPIKPEHTMTKAQVVRELAEHGFALVADFDGLPWQHAMAFAPVAATGARLQPQQVLHGFLAAAKGSDARIVLPYLTTAARAGQLPELAAELATELRAGPNGCLLASLRAADGSTLPHGRDEVVLARDTEGRWSIEAVRKPETFVRPHGARRPFVAMHTGTGKGTVAEQAVLVHELGFDGLAWDLDRIPELRRSSEAAGMDVFSAYGVLELGGEQGEGERQAPLRAAMDALAGGPGMLWLALRHDKLAARDPAGDDAAVRALTSLLVHADATGVEIALYPHHGFWLETTDDVLRLCTRLAHPRLGLCFNLCHFLRTGDEPDPAALLARCGKHLFAVTVNGADLDGSEWRTLIRPLGEGTFDLRRFLASLDAVGFAGPVGLQGFGIDQPPREHLAKSMAAFRAAQDAAPASAQAEGRRLQVLFLGAPTPNGPHHDPITRYATLKKGLGIDGIDLTYSEDPATALTAATLAAFDAVLLYGNWDQGGVMPAAQLNALLAYVDGGGGFVPVHCASACWGRSPAFVQLVGGRFARHGGEEFAVVDTAPDHPILAGLAGYRAWDETYEHDEHATDRVILQKREQEPWTWVRTHGLGRVFYTAGGHDHRVWDLPAFQELLQNGILWAVGPQKRLLLTQLALPKLEQEAVSLPGYRQRREITLAQKPLSPAESMKLVQVPTDMQLSLFACEPDITNPIHVAWDHRGRAFVVETVDYPNNLATGDLGHDRITICADTDGDGAADRFTRFAEHLSIPTSLTFANGGVVCTNGPDMLFLADTDGDDRADVRKVLFTGFHMGDTHAGVSNLRWAQDGWIWATIGYSGFSGVVGGERREFAQGLLRFLPDGSKLEFVQHTTNNTWGLGFTSEGDVVGSTANGNPSWFHTFPEAAYRAVGLEPPHTPRADDNPRFLPMSRDIRQVDFFDRYTSAAGHAVYTASRFPSSYRDCIAFVCEPTGKLVANFALQRQGAGFVARQSPNNLFASADAWTSPVCAEVGPDGAVWICDWYNLIIQHNPTPTRSSAGVESKTGRGNAYETPLRDTQYGRIYRVFPRGTADDAFPALASDAPQTWLAGLSHGNLSWRLHAQRLLVEQRDAALAPELLRLAQAGGVAGPHALQVLAACGALTDEIATAALRSAHAPTFRAAIALANVSVLKQVFVTDRGIGGTGRALAEVLVRFADSAKDPEIGTAILRTAAANETAIFDDATLRDAWQIAARRHADTVLAAAAAAGVTRTAPAEQPNLLQNADFTSATNGVPTGWHDLRVYSGAGADTVAVAHAAEGRTGAALRVSTERASDCGVAALVKVQPGTRYRLSGWIRTENVTPSRGGDGVMLNVHGGKRTAGVKGTTDWTQVAVEFDAGAAEIVVHCLFGGYGGAKGTAWFDDVALVAIGGGNTLAGAIESLAAFRGAQNEPAPMPIARTFAPDAAVHERGAMVYSRTCIACHGFDGKGLAKTFPPLDGSTWLAGTPERAIHIVLHGLQGPITVGDTRFEAVMPALGPQLSDAEIADVLTYARQRWSNDASPIPAATVTARRTATRRRAGMWTAEELGK